jgi:hypothetical protein
VQFVVVVKYVNVPTFPPVALREMVFPTTTLFVFPLTVNPGLCGVRGGVAAITIVAGLMVEVLEWVPSAARVAVTEHVVAAVAKSVLPVK